MNIKIVDQTKHPAQNLIKIVNIIDSIKETPTLPRIRGHPSFKSEKYS